MQRERWLRKLLIASEIGQAYASTLKEWWPWCSEFRQKLERGSASCALCLRFAGCELPWLRLLPISSSIFALTSAPEPRSDVGSADVCRGGALREGHAGDDRPGCRLQLLRYLI